MSAQINTYLDVSYLTCSCRETHYNSTDVTFVKKNPWEEVNEISSMFMFLKMKTTQLGYVG